jgi:predicted O-methyltransferase YrrM
VGLRRRPHVWRRPDNVILVEGLFQDTLEPFLSEHTGPAGFVHIDSDIYSSAAYVLAKLTPRLASGCILVFDELMPSNTAYYPNWRNHEWRALTEWLPTAPLELEPLAHNGAAGVAFRVL